MEQEMLQAPFCIIEVVFGNIIPYLLLAYPDIL